MICFEWGLMCHLPAFLVLRGNSATVGHRASTHRSLNFTHAQKEVACLCATPDVKVSILAGVSWDAALKW